ncbi:MAG TPA: type VI secretion system tube protein Hcp [Syntrophorhabdales bacterium]|nr:type VI secretion system tube protein Hcp [Syntrophorhabdales bacterium]
MAFDAFLKIDGIPGESTDDKHKDWIEVLSYGLGIQQPASATASSSGGATSERANFQDFSITKALDKASPKLALACADGTHIASITLELCRAGGDKLKYMEYKLTNCIISSHHDGGSSGGAETLPVETVTFNYGKIEWTYTQQKRADGSGGGQVAAGWDLQINKKV